MNLPTYLQAQIAAETQYLAVPGAFTLESGEVLSQVEVAYRTWGDPANATEHAVLICHALTGSADVEAWWPDIIGEGRAFDPARDYIICAHRSVEQGHAIMQEQLGCEPLLDLQLRLGEGTGAALAMNVVEAAAAVLTEVATFAEAGVTGTPVA